MKFYIFQEDGFRYGDTDKHKDCYKFGISKDKDGRNAQVSYGWASSLSKTKFGWNFKRNQKILEVEDL